MTHSLTHVSDQTLVTKLKELVARDRSITAEMLIHIAEFDSRRLYLPAGHSSMFSYCLEELGFCEQAAFKRIRAARAARRFPVIIMAVADGRLNLSTVVLLAAHLTGATTSEADELIGAASHKTKPQVEQLLAERFPQADVPSQLRPLVRPVIQELENSQLSPGTVELPSMTLSVPAAVGIPAATPSTAIQARRPDPPARVAALAPQRFALQVTLSQSGHDDLRRAQALLSHRIPSGDLAQVLERALRTLVVQLEKEKSSITSRPRSGTAKQSNNPRHIPAQVKRAVWKRDGGRCTFVSDAGHRCDSRTRLEFDHVQEVARGGQASVSGIRLLCRAHNHYMAERTFGAEFMRHKRERSKLASLG